MSSLIVEVCEIKNIEPHPNADRLDIATIKGWEVIVGRGQYVVGDLVIFIPPDAILPDEMIEEHKLDYLKKNGRVGTVKLRGIISQGLALPCPDFPVTLGEDLASYFGITKYEVPEPQYNPQSGNRLSRKILNPLFDKYTDIENIKNYDGIFQEGELVVVTEKLHGTNARFGNLPISISDNQPIFYKLVAWVKKNLLGHTHEFVWGSHNVQKGSLTKHSHFYGEDVWGEIAKRYDLKNVLPNGLIFYGEIVGKNIQDLNYGSPSQTWLFLFDIKNVETGKYLNWEDVRDWGDRLGIHCVPEIAIAEFSQDLVNKFTSGNTYLNSVHMREGIVIRPVEETQDRKLGRKILKSISPDYLLRKGGTEFK